jgi:polyhydroxyalkanoate synthesis repressor PhaR
MTSAVQPIIVKRYANRRLYHSRTGRYVSRRDLEKMARNGEEFVVVDSAAGEDITRSVLGQIIVAQEISQSAPLLPADFFRQLITFYGDTIRGLLSLYLEFSLLTITHKGVRPDITDTGRSVLNLVDEQVQRNIQVFETMLSAFSLSKSQSQPEQRPTPYKHGDQEPGS